MPVLTNLLSSYGFYGVILASLLCFLWKGELRLHLTLLKKCDLRFRYPRPKQASRTKPPIAQRATRRPSSKSRGKRLKA